MLKRWLHYLAVWCVCLIFYCAYRQWMAWIVLMSASLLPLLSLAVSLPAMLLSRVTVTVPKALAVETPAILDVRLECPLPPPVWQVRIEARHTLSGKLWLLQPGGDCPTEHSGALYFHFSRARVFDYMGLFCLPRKVPADFKLMIRPRQIRPRDLPDPEKNIHTFWKPKAGGGFSENHELRLYRPGDSLRQIHWKLSSKTGKLIYREPMVMGSNHLQLRLFHGGSPKQIDTKLGKLLWTGLYLLRRGLAFDVLADTADGQKLWHIDSKRSLLDVLDALLCTKPLEEDGAAASTAAGGSWQYCIGGGADEAK